ncbi:uncharacterized protein LOC108736303 isoform X3 [Agrilus planipennis]|uniref:Uncharacterized protein LOC108736303 isoform X3 n=1 Tax=Agrilus planipennis TaxID=224129 RepID=A0A7F5R425_AGRPL|nr:uncharacterized protein LOC108736303 isoform X3 [Agrilus planipennis]
MDLAESVDDLICVFDGTGDTTMDTLAMLVFGWILVALFVLWLGKFLYEKFAKRNDTKLKSETAKIDGKAVTTDSVDSVNNKVKRSSSLPKSGGGKATGGAGSGGGGYVPPTPPVRKRITRASPGPDLGRKTKYIPAPQCTGADNVSVLWVNDVFQWLFNDLVIVNELFNEWILTLNEYTKKAVTEQGVGVEFVRILPETNPPSLTNLFCECDSKDDVTLTCDCEATPAFQLKCFRQKGDKVDISHYRVNVNRFRARLNIYAVTEKLKVDIKCDGWPDIKVALAPVGNIKNNLDETHLQEVISEIVTNALRNAELHLNLGQYPTCPRLVRHVGTPGPNLPVHYDSMMNAVTSTPNHHTPNYTIQGNKRLVVKIVRASQLGANQGCAEPYCVVEMDEPPQRNQTSVQKNTDSPFWDEHFLFDLSPNTAEFLFEIYDRAAKPHRFLGLGIVGVEELLANPSQRQIITLQSRPYETDPVSGTLTVEFSFIEGADLPSVGDGQPYKIKENISPSLSPTRRNNSLPLQNNVMVNGDHYGENQNQERSFDKNTLTIHSVQRQPSQRLVRVQQGLDGDWKEIERIEIDDESKLENSPKEEMANGKVTKDEKNGNLLTEDNANGKVIAGEDKKENKEVKENGKQDTDGKPTEYGNLNQPLSDNTEIRGRPRRRRDFFSTIKRRLNKSKTRSKSAGPSENDNYRDDSLNRSVSADRKRGSDDRGRYEENSRRSSLSEASGLSSASTRTYLNEASTLVLETVENGIKKHYLVPLSLAQKSKIKKKGTKLHIFNDHTFIARHLSGGTICQVCSKSVPRRIGKQGYECRDCLLKCHKHCHVKVNDNCPTSTIHNIELSYIKNPLTDKNLKRL